MPMLAAIESEFPGAADTAEFVQRTVRLLVGHGFHADNTIACVGVCRDEIARPLIAQVAEAWGEAFNFSSLAGMLTLGRTGFAAARGHAPMVGGRERFVFISMPHIGIDRDGTLGSVHRRGQQEATPACGALVAAMADLRSGRLSLDLDPTDIEQSLLRRRLNTLAAGGQFEAANAGIAELTRLLRRAVLDDLEALIASADMSAVDYAVFSGVQIHTPDGDLVWPAEAYVTVSARRFALSGASAP